MYEKQTNADDVLEIGNDSAEHLTRKKKKAQILDFVNTCMEMRQKSDDSVSGVLQEVLDLLRYEKLLQNGG